MRIAALIFGLLGTVGSGALGYKWYSDAAKSRAGVELARKINEEVKDPKEAAKLDRLDRLVRTSYGLMGAAVLGLVGCGLVAARRGVVAGLLFLVGFAVPLVLMWDAGISMFTFGLGVAAPLSFFVRKRTPYVRPKARPGISEDDDIVG